MGIFSFPHKKPACPITEETRIWMENAFIWMIKQFGEEKMLGIKQLRPLAEDFPFSFKADENDAEKAVQFLCHRMDINSEETQIQFYSDSIIEIDNAGGNMLFTQEYEDVTYSAGLFIGKNEGGKFTIGIEHSMLKDSERLIATITHELGHVKILGENRLQENDEFLTDLVTVFFGSGIFTANASFRYLSSINSWGYSRQGYLTQQEWGYALALFAYIRGEINPAWIDFLTPNLKADFKKSEAYIAENTDKVLV